MFETLCEWKKAGFGGMCLSPRDCGMCKIGKLWFRLVWAKKQDPVSKITKAKREKPV
jgi:hypothetical protein